MSLLQEKKDFSLDDHVNEFVSTDLLTIDQINEIIINENNYPAKFKELYLNNNKEIFPVNHITDELEIFNPNIYDKVSICNTTLGKIYTNKILKSPSSNYEILNKRQDILKNICQNFTEKLDIQIKNTIQSLNDILWFYKPKNEHSDYIYSLIFYNHPYLKFLNKNEPFLTLTNAYKIIISPIMTAASPLLYVIVPFVLMRLMKIPLPFSFFVKLLWQQSGAVSLPFIKNELMATMVKWFSKALSAFLYCQNVYASYSTSKTTNKIVNLFQTKLEHIKKLLTTNSDIRGNETFSSFLGQQEYPNNFQRIENGKVYNGQHSLLSNKGRILKDFYEFVENKNMFLKILNNIGFIDCYFGFAKLIKEKSYINIPRFLKLEKPSLKLEGIWHPAIQKEKNIKNSIEFSDSSRNYLLTGPNAAGKSTFIKSVFLNIYLGQTIGICNSEKMEITPFKYLLTGIRNQDSQGSESLFEAEVHKIRNYLDIIKKEGKSGFTFSILDEIFTSTNYQEGFSASYGLCQTIGSLKNSFHIVASHYTDLFKLEKEKGLGFKNIRFSVVFNGDKIIFPYKLEDGYSKQFIALRLMKNKNCDNEFLDNCLKCLENIDTKKPEEKKKKKKNKAIV